MIVWETVQVRKKYIYNYYYKLIKAGAVCPSTSSAKKAAKCTTDKQIKKYGLFKLYHKIRSDPSKVSPAAGAECLNKYCPSTSS